MITARALVALGGADLTPEDLAAGRLTHLDRAEHIGEGTDWASAKSAAGVPDGALVLHWTRA